jgi:cobalt-zinc-cadmium efflux system membrane fusion protein
MLATGAGVGGVVLAPAPIAPHLNGLRYAMKSSLHIGRRGVAAAATLTAVAAGFLLVKPWRGRSANAEQPESPVSAAATSTPQATVELSPGQLNAIKIQPVGTYRFPVEKDAVGSIDFDEDRSVQVFSPYQGKIITPLVNLGDKVVKGQPLYTIDSPDLIQAASTLIGAAATFDLTSKELERAKGLGGPNGVSEREIEQATSDQQTAEGTLTAARDALGLFGKTDAEIDQIAATHKIDSVLVVRSPVTGRVTARNAQPGLLVEPGNAPAPYSVADLSTKWMVANVTEGDSPLFQLGQPIEATVVAYAGRVFRGRISALGAAVDPNTHRLMVRCDIADPDDALRPGMLASFVIRVQAPVEALAIPMTGVVRNGDGTMAAWVTADRHRFVQRIITIGRQQDGQYQVLGGLQRGDLAVTDGAIFLSNMLQAPPTD